MQWSLTPSAASVDDDDDEEEEDFVVDLVLLEPLGDLVLFVDLVDFVPLDPMAFAVVIGCGP